MKDPLSDWSIRRAYGVFQLVRSQRSLTLFPSTLIALSALVISFISLGGCGEKDPSQALPNTSATACRPGVAQIAVHDGSLQHICGCTESTGQSVVYPPAALTCTVPVDTFVLFYFLDTHLRHQLVPQGTSGFNAGAPFNPERPSSNKVHSAGFSQTGSFAFKDVFLPTVQGVIVVQ
ncbi:MAG: hypothetical protein H7222_10595 [Methylotenera sp.]|nr:hypothetical protein [Oligoflexia bacterium]